MIDFKPLAVVTELVTDNKQQLTEDTALANPITGNTETSLNVPTRDTPGENNTTASDAADVVIPAGYTALEYLQSTGTQWIDTGWSTTSGMTVHAKTSSFGIGSKLSQKYPLFNEVGDNAIWDFDGRLFPDGTGHVVVGLTTGLGLKATSTIITSGDLPSRLYDVKFSTVAENGFLEIDGRRDNGPVSGKTDPLNVGLFSPNQGKDICSGKMAFAKIWNSAGSLVRNLIPVRRDSDGVLGMYDLVGGKLYTNAGTGDFVAGEKQITLRDRNLLYLTTGIPVSKAAPSATGFIGYVNTLADDQLWSCTGTVRYYDFNTNSYYQAAILYIAKYNADSFCYYYYDKNKILVKVVSTLGYLTIMGG